MIHEILPTDVEFAKAMLHSSHSDAEILACLASRGLEPTKAAALVDDLRHGRTPTVQLPFAAGQSPPAANSRPLPAVRHTAPQPPPPQSRPHKHSHRRGGLPWWFVLLILIFVGALGYVLCEAGGCMSKVTVPHDRHELPPPPGK
jgi:hypothetical protein